MQEQIQLTKALSEPLSQLQQTARNIAEISQECKLEMDPDEYVESFKPFSMDITYHWSKVQPHVNAVLVCTRICMMCLLRILHQQWLSYMLHTVWQDCLLCVNH